MPALRKGEKMQRCRSEFHDSIRRQKYYIKRTYYNELEQQFCPGCCSYLMNTRMLLTYETGKGYTPVQGASVQTILSTYGADGVVLA